MQEMIEYLLSETEMLMDKTRMILVAKADSLLELEKQQIQDAVDRMTNTLIANEIITESGCTDDSSYGQIYYNQTFINNL